MVTTNLKTPGVYIEEISKFPPSIAQVETAIPAFIGYTKIAKVGTEDFHANPEDSIVRAIRITSLLEYEQFFGTSLPERPEAIEVTITETRSSDGRVLNREVIARNLNPNAHNMYYSLQAYFANGGGPCYIVSVGPMKEENLIILDRLQKGLKEIEKEDEVTLIVFPESQSLEDADYGTLLGNALDQCGKLQDRFVVMDMKVKDTDLSIFNAAATFRNASLPLDNLKYGACYTPNIETVFNYIYTPENVKVVTISSGDADSAEESTMNERKPTQDGGGDDIIYNLIKAALDQLPLVLPPSPLVVGQYAKTDNARGVWKAPANVALNSVVKPTMKISMEDQAELNVHSTGKSINAIRAFTGKGILIWGARTLAGNDNEWRYVPVRRFFNMAEESIKKGTEAFVFEPNDANTWTRVKAMIDNFLTLQWRAGALQGIKPEHAFYVKVGLNETMTALDILEGRLIIEIGMAVVRPAEFIILRFSHKMAES
jgi:phage tail sheath protein FI